jgi:hypothetical protein
MREQEEGEKRRVQKLKEIAMFQGTSCKSTHRTNRKANARATTEQNNASSGCRDRRKSHEIGHQSARERVRDGTLKADVVEAVAVGTKTGDSRWAESVYRWHQVGRGGMPIRGRGVTGDRGAGGGPVVGLAGAAQLAGVSNEAGTAVSTVSTAVSSLGFCQVLAR